MTAAAVVVIINRPRPQPQPTGRASPAQSDTSDTSEVSVLIDPDSSDAEILAAALAQVERDQG